MANALSRTTPYKPVYSAQPSVAEKLWNKSSARTVMTIAKRDDQGVALPGGATLHRRFR
jgi:hypothetical protein